jgi:carbonic anhydrase
MDILETLAARNDDFAQTGFVPGLALLPQFRTMILGCVDPRVDPAHVLGAALGEVAVIRNIGGRVTPHVIAEIALLAQLTKTLVGFVPPTDVIVMQHTDCGITRLQDPPDMLAQFFDVENAALGGKHVDDPRSAVGIDVELLRSAPQIPVEFRVSGVVYDVVTGRIEIVDSPR